MPSEPFALPLDRFAVPRANCSTDGAWLPGCLFTLTPPRDGNLDVELWLFGEDRPGRGCDNCRGACDARAILKQANDEQTTSVTLYHTENGGHFRVEHYKIHDNISIKQIWITETLCKG